MIESMTTEMTVLTNNGIASIWGPTYKKKTFEECSVLASESRPTLVSGRTWGLYKDIYTYTNNMIKCA